MERLQQTLAQWYGQHRRVLPWREDPSPYHVWLSEIILQQTRVNQGLDYYLRFVGRWPGLRELAAASEEEVLKQWQGLGYYSRARNLHRCARELVERHGGAFPKDYRQLMELPGIGSYTAAAIASIAFDLPHAVVDGNVYRVLSRLYDIDTPINKNEGTTLFADLADHLLDRKHPGRHNQALMEFGALHCLPQRPDCQGCPLGEACLARAHGTVAQRPVKAPKAAVRTRYLHYLVFQTPDQGIYLRKREDNDIWKNLYDFPCIESDEPLDTEALVASDTFRQLTEGLDFVIGHSAPPYRHKLTHQTLVATFLLIKINGFLSSIQTKKLLLAAENELGSFPVPKLIENYLQNNLN
jgi:A/G-specific adenine glycosylase